MNLCNFIFFLLALLTTNGLYPPMIFNGSNSANTSKTIVPNTENSGNEVTTILFEKRPSLKEICAIINDSSIDCTCENFKYFCKQSRVVVCSRYWDKVEGAVNVTVSVFGVLGNTLVLFIALTTWKGNGRFRKIVALLALADLIFAIVEIIIAAQLFKTCKWLYRTFFCKFLIAIINIGGVFALCLIAIIALERYFAIVKPFNIRSKYQRSFWVWPLVALVFSIISAIPIFIVYEVSADGLCVEKWPQGSNGSLIYSLYLLIGTMIIPMGIILYFYYCVVKKLLENSRNLQTTGNGKEILKQRERLNRRIMFILLVIAGVFFVLVLPNRLIWVIVSITGTANMPNTTYRILKYTALFPYLFHVLVNPFIYSFIDKNFQTQIVGLFKAILKNSFIESIGATQTTNQITTKDA